MYVLKISQLRSLFSTEHKNQVLRVVKVCTFSMEHMLGCSIVMCFLSYVFQFVTNQLQNMYVTLEGYTNVTSH